MTIDEIIAGARREYNEWLARNRALVSIKLQMGRRGTFWFLYD